MKYYQLGNRRIPAFKVLGPLFGYQYILIDRSCFSKSKSEKERMKEIKSEHKNDCKRDGKVFKGLNSDHIIITYQGRMN